MLGGLFLVNIPPISLYSNNFTISTGSSDFNNFLHIAVADENFDPAAIFINRSVSLTGWQEIYCKDNHVCGHVVTVEVQRGTVNIRHLN